MLAATAVSELLGGISVCRLAGELRAALGDLRVSCCELPHDVDLACEFHMLPKTCGWPSLLVCRSRLEECPMRWDDRLVARGH